VTILLGCIADDLTGATDLAISGREGMRTVSDDRDSGRELACRQRTTVVIALKIPHDPGEDAVRQVAVALGLVEAQTAPARSSSKYCSTFDSTDAGNIGPGRRCAS